MKEEIREFLLQNSPHYRNSRAQDNPGATEWDTALNLSFAHYDTHLGVETCWNFNGRSLRLEKETSKTSLIRQTDVDWLTDWLIHRYHRVILEESTKRIEDPENAVHFIRITRVRDWAGPTYVFPVCLSGFDTDKFAFALCIQFINLVKPSSYSMYHQLKIVFLFSKHVRTNSEFCPV